LIVCLFFLEQLCINYTNEKLQQYFNQHIFKEEQTEYEKEKIDWNDRVGYIDNGPCLELIEQNKLSVFALLNEECIFPKATDITWLQKLEKNLIKHPFYKKPRLTNTAFAINHYAGEVAYEVSGFLEKNKDTLPEEFIALTLASLSSIVKALLKPPSQVEPGKKATAQTVIIHFKVIYCRTFHNIRLEPADRFNEDVAGHRATLCALH
jgi:myosin heavy subunit